MATQTTARVGDLCDQIRGVTYSKADVIDSARTGFKAVLRANSITDTGLIFDDLVFVPESKIGKQQFVKANDIVIAASSGSIDVVGKAARALRDFDGGFGAFCKVLRPNGKVEPAYFAHFFKTQAYRRRVSELAAGASINNLRNEHLDDLEIPLPPLPEQRRIAAILDKAEALRAKRREAIAKLDQLLQAVFLDMFGDPVTNPKGWPLHAVADLCQKVTVGIVVRPASHYVDSGIPAIRSLNIGVNQIIESDFVYFSQTSNDCELAKTKLKHKDVVIVRSGQPGKAAVIPKHLDGANAIDVLIARTNPSELLPEFLTQFLNSSAGRRLVLSEQRGQVQKHLNVTQLAAAPLPLPPMALQTQFLELAQEIERNLACSRTSSKRLEGLISSIQSQVFTSAV